MNKTRLLFLTLLVALVSARLCHTGILWAEETLPLAAAQQMRAGKVLYRDIWFDKPPLVPLIHTALGGEAGWPLRLAGALYALLCCAIAWAFARDLWGEREGMWAAGGLGFFLVFDFPSSAIPLAADLLMLAPHLAAVWMAARRRPLWAGILAGVAFTVNPKALLVLAVCACWTWAARAAGDGAAARWGAAGRVLAGFVAVTAASLAWMWSAGALAGYWDEVWRWGRVYAGTTFVGAPVANGVLRTLNWAGFHAAIVLAAAFAAVPRPFGLGVGYAKAQAEGGGVDGAASALPGGSRCWAVWLLLSLVGVVAGWRFFPRYYFQILPVVVLLAARGMAVARGWCRTVALLLLLIPVVRFAPAYYVAARDAGWRDTAMDRDSRAAARMLAAVAKPGDTLFVWGYRPEIYVYSHLPAATRFLDSQPLTGVPADRHLTQSTPVETEGSRGRRAELAGSRPSFVVDGLGEYNRRLAVTRFGDLREWMAAYRPVGRTSGCVIYRRE